MIVAYLAATVSSTGQLTFALTVCSSWDRKDARYDGALEHVTSSDAETLRFIVASFHSIWALEVLLALKRIGGNAS